MGLTAADRLEVQEMIARYTRARPTQPGVPLYRPGTTAAQGETIISVLADGDTAPIDASNLTGRLLPPGARVMLLFTPPHGVFIAGILGQVPMIGYAPVVTQSATVTWSAATSWARYEKVGRTVHVDLGLSLTSAGTGNNPIYVTLPAPASQSVADCGVGHYHDTAHGSYRFIVQLASDTTKFHLLRTDLATIGGVVGTDPNFTVANGDYLYANFVYEAAS